MSALPADPDAQLALLVQAFLVLETERECLDFLQNILSPSELKAIANRLQAMGMFLDGRRHREVSGKLGMGLVTVARIARLIQNRGPAIRAVIERARQRLASRARPLRAEDPPSHY